MTQSVVNQERSNTASIHLLQEPFQLGDLTVNNRIAMAPLTRMRAPLPGNAPNELMREY